MRLVHSKEGETGAREKLQAPRRDQPLGRHIKEVEGSTAHGALDLDSLAGRET